jgi:amino acid adenylation domain-containing protein
MEETIPLLLAQLRTWNAQARDLSIPVYKIADRLDIHGPVDPALMRAAYEQVAAETEALRLVIVTVAGEHRQRVAAEPTPFHYADLRGEADPGKAAESWMRDDLAGVTDPERLCAAALLETADDRYVLYWRVHHAVLDGWSLALLFNRIAAVYSALAKGSSPVGGGLPPLGRLIDGEAAYRASRRLMTDRAYWTAKMADRPEPVTLGTGQAEGVAVAHRRRTDLDGDLLRRIRETALRLEVSTSDICVGAVALYVGRMADAGEVVLGLPSPARLSPDVRNVPGMVTNGVPVRIPTNPDTPLSDYLRRVSSEVREALLHSRYPTAELSRDLGSAVANRPLWGPIANVMSFPYRLDFAGAPATVCTVSVPFSPDVSVYFSQTSSDGAMELVVDAHPGRHSAGDTESHLRRLLVLIGAMTAADPELPVGGLALMGPEERERLLALGAGPVHAIEEVRIEGLLEAWAARTPSAAALELPDRTVSFAELDSRANRLARLLRGLGAGPGRLVGFALSKSADRYAAPLAVLKTGAAFVPVDPSYPLPRIAYIVGDAQPMSMLLDASTAGLAPGLGTDCVVLDHPDTQRLLAGLSDAPLQDEVGGPATEDGTGDRNPPAYVIYTSGSTGTPKGVVVGHRGVVNLVAAYVDELQAGPGTRTLHSASPGFDAFVGEMTQSFLNGGTLVVTGERIAPGPALARLVAARRINDLVLPPSALEVMAPQEWPPGTTITVVGEPCSSQVVERWAAACRLVNGYGPTEATVSSTMSRRLAHTGAPPPIGRPLRNVRGYVLDDRGELAPVGATGELYVGGAGVALRYLNQEHLTAERFLRDPFGPPGARIYRTGDLVRWTPGGELVFVGRGDDQVQLRGFRIELGEIEATLVRSPEVVQAAAAVRTDDTGDRRLVAYVVPAPGAVVDVGRLRQSLAAELPTHLVPGVIAVIGELPRNAHGKLDRRALPEPQPTEPAHKALPRDALEEILAGLFAESLRLPQVGVDEDFLALGGHSLLATRLLGAIRRALGAEVSVRDFFDRPTVVGVATKLGPGHLLPRTDHPGLVPLRATGADAPLFCFPPPGQDSWVGLRLAAHLPRSVPLYGLHCDAGLSVTARAVRCADTVRAALPAGPYRLLGWGAGGALAHAVAARLQSDGGQVELLAVLDAAPAAPSDPEAPRFKGDLHVLTAGEAAPDETAEAWQEYVSGRVAAHRRPGPAADPFRPPSPAAVADVLTAALHLRETAPLVPTAEG